MIPLDDHLLPLTETPLNKALAAVATRYDALNAPARQIWNPWQCPPGFLQFLAHAFSVDLWEDDWSETRKRAIIANAIQMHRLKGTEAGLRAYVYYTPGIIKGIVAPPQRVYSGPTPTREEREAWLKNLPQVRVWRTFERGRFTPGCFCGGHSAKMFVGEGFFLPSTAKQRLKRRARWVVGGAETDERVSEFGSYFRLHMRGDIGDGAYCNSVALKRFYIPSTAPKRILTVAPKLAAPWKTPIRAGLTAVQSEPELIKERGRAPASVFCGTHFSGGFFVPSAAWRRIYLRFPVDDGSRPFGRPAIQFMGLDRYAWPAHTARLKMSIPGTAPDIAAGDTMTRAAKRYWIPSGAGRRIGKTCRGIIASKRASDSIEIDFSGRKTLLSGLDVLQAGLSEFVL